MRTGLKKQIFVPILGIAIALSSGCSTFGSHEKSYDLGADGSVQSEDRIQKHFYAGTGIGSSWMQPDTSEVAGVNVNDRYETGGQITLGMDVSRQLAIELHSADLGSAGLSPAGRVNYHIHGGSALIYAGKNRHKFKRRGLSGYGRLGLGFLDNSTVGNVSYVKDNATHILIGAGLEYMTNIGLGLRLEGISFEEDVRYAQLGLVYRTGKRKQRKPVQIVQTPAPVIAPPIPAVVVAEPVIEPEPEPVDTCSEINGVLDGVNFHSDSDELTPESTQNLDAVASRLIECSSVPVRITAHTDSVGAESYNYNLSGKRAASVVNYLRNRGIDTSRMTSEPFGETQPIGDNSTPEGRRKNRRVELITGY